MEIAAKSGRARAAPRSEALDWDAVHARVEARRLDPFGDHGGADPHGWAAIHAQIDRRAGRAPEPEPTADPTASQPKLTGSEAAHAEINARAAGQW